MLPLFDRNERLPVYLRDALDRGEVVLTANGRAARALQAAFAEDQLHLAESSGATAWLSPRMIDWSSWVGELWEEYARALHRSGVSDPPMPLTGMQEHQLWQVVQGADRNRVVAPDRMAELAQQAYGLLGSYCAHPQRVSTPANLFGDMHEDAERFFSWAASFDRLCQQNGWVSRTRLEETLIAGLGRLRAPAELCLVGFDREMPVQSALITALEKAGTRVTRFIPEETQTVEAPVLVEARDRGEELEACAWWCRAQLAEASGSPGPRRIGVIVPILERVRAELDRVFCRILMPGLTVWGGDGGADAELPYEFSLGTPLGSLPLVKAARLVLRWLQAPVGQAEFTSLMTSGYLAGTEAEQFAMARLDAELRRNGSPEVALEMLLRKRSQLPKAVQERLANAQARAAREGISPGSRSGGSREGAVRQRASFAHWAELVPLLLADAGWPGYREVDSFAYQAQQRWNRLLAEVAELGFNGVQPTWSEFLRTLDAQAQAVIFAAESSSAPIQILGAFESSGQSFDAIWFLGVDDSHWPAVGRPHPLLPGWLQRDAEMPHALPDTDWRLARQTTARICNGAPTVILSYPLQEQAVTLRVSPLAEEHAGPVRRTAAEVIQSYSVRSVAAGSGTPGPGSSGTPGAVASASGLCAEMLEKTALEWMEDDSGRLPWPREQSAGGADILKSQAACAFQSFATRRLHARPLEEAEPGLDARERGNLLHKVLASLWAPGAAEDDAVSSDRTENLGGDRGTDLGRGLTRLHTLADLERADRNQTLAELLTQHITEAFREQRAEAGGDAWQQAYLTGEERRVHDRITDWLACELERQPFSIYAIETDLHDIRVGDLHLRVRPDRVDTLADGTHLLIDYKTGKVSPNDWHGDRPREPQLPVYALFGGVEQVSGVGFAQIRADGTKLMARAEDPPGAVSEQLGKLSDRNRFDDEIRAEWREALVTLAQQFLSGDARVNPRDGAETCKYCPLAGVCRVHEGKLLDDEEDPGDEYA